MNAHVERFIQTLQVECLEKFIVLGTRHMDYLVAEFVKHYNTERPHSSLEFRPPAAPPTSRAPPTVTGRVWCKQRLGGLLKHFYRAA